MQQVRIDFDNPGLPQSLGVVEGESQSRIFQATLYKSGAAYTAPAGAVYSIMYRGFGPQNQGWYDTIEDGAGKRAACTVSGNVVTCELARQALRVPGHLTVVLCLTDAKGYMLKSWPIMADVRNDGYEDTGESEMYFNLSGIAGNYLTQLEKAMADAEATRNNLISTSAQAKKDIDAKAAETLKTIPESYTELDGSVKQIKEDIIKIDNSAVETNGNTVEIIFDNIFNAETSTEGYYLLNDGVTERENVLYSHSDYIPLSKYKKIKFSGFNLGNAVIFYKNDRTLQSNTKVSDFSEFSEIPQDAEYMRFNYGTSSKNSVNVSAVSELKRINANQVEGLYNTKYVSVGPDRNIKTLKDAIEYAEVRASKSNRVVIVLDKGTYNALDGYDLLKQSSSFVGLTLPDYVDIVGVSGIDETIIYAELPVDITSYPIIRNNISTLNLWKNNSLKNLTVKAKNIRYAVHNDDYKVHAADDAAEKFENCHFIYEPLTSGVDYNTVSKVPFGTGMAKGRKMQFKKCVFETQETESKFSFLVHNNTEQNKPCSIEMECCKFIGGYSGIKVSSAGSNQTDTIIFRGCKGQYISFCKESVYQGTKIEFKLYGFGNSFSGFKYENVAASADNVETDMMI